MEQFDQLIREMAEKEKIIVPNGFDERVRAALGELPPKQKKRKLGAVKGALIAAAACLLLMGTALASRPELWGRLMEALGSFAPYAAEQEDQTYTADGFELKVLSTLTDGSVIRAYVQVRDLEGHRLSADMWPIGGIFFVDSTDLDSTKSIHATYGDESRYVVYDEETETVLLVFTSWGMSFADLSTVTLEFFDIDHALPDGDEVFDEPLPVQLRIPLTVEVADKLTFDETSDLARHLGAKQVELSPLGLTAVLEYNVPVKWTKLPTVEEEASMLYQPVRVRLKDGTELCRTELFNQIPSGEAIYSYPAENLYRVIRSWTFPDAIDLEQVESIFAYGEYFPVN